MTTEIVNVSHNRWQAVSEGEGLALLRWRGDVMLCELAGGTLLGTMYRSSGRIQPDKSIAYTWRAYLPGPAGRELARGAQQAEAVTAILAAHEGMRDRAYKLGSIDAYAEQPARDMSDDGSAWLMDELGETSPTTEANAPYREMLCERYMDGYCDAAGALA